MVYKRITFWFIWCMLEFDLAVTTISSGEQEGRIYGGALAKTITTLHPTFERILSTLRGCYLKVLPTPGQTVDEEHRNDSSAFFWNINRMTLETESLVRKPLGDFYLFSLGAYCPNGSYHLWVVTVRVSEQNRFPPEFSKKTYTFRCPLSATKGYWLGQVAADDVDTIVYNSKIHYRLWVTNSDDEDFVIDELTGEMSLVRNMNDTTFKGSKLYIVEACDYGSPQKCASAEVVVVPYSLTSPTDVQVLTANPKYQIICWDAPVVGSPDVYMLRIINEKVDSVKPLYKMDSKSSKSKTECAITQEQNSNVGDRISVLVSAKSTNDQSTSEAVQFTITDEIKCDGDCNSKGTPYCYNDGDKRPLQLEWNGEKFCKCDLEYEGPSCTNIKKCKPQHELTDVGPTFWESTAVGVEVNVKCPYGPKEKNTGATMKRRCWIDVAAQKAFWNAIQDKENCRTKKNFLEHLNTFEHSLLNASLDTIEKLTNRMEKEYLKIALIDFDVASAMFQLIEQLASSAMLQKSEHADLSLRLKKLLIKYAENVTLPVGEKEREIRSRNVIMTILILTNKSNIDETFAAKEALLHIPKAVINEARKKSKQKSDAGVQVTLITFKNHNFYQSTDSRAQQNHPVLEIMIKNIDHNARLPKPITFGFKLKSEKNTNNNGLSLDDTVEPEKYICVYWEEKGKKWSQDGLTTELSEGLVKCKTDHLTGFSILLDFDQKLNVDSENLFLLNLLSWIGCICSIIGLLLTICTYSVFRYLNKEKAGKILLNLCAAMLLLNVVFLFSSVRPYVNYSYQVCVCIGVLLHYATLASLLWMGVEAANMYHMLVHVFASSERHFLLKRFAIAWGLPVVIVGITATIEHKRYVDPKDSYCRLSPLNAAVHYGAFVGPACLVLVCNCIVFAFVLRVLSLSSDTKNPSVSPQTQSTKATNLSSQIRGALTVMVLLGITWVFGAFAIGPARLPFKYVFCVLNSSQGFIIFLVRCLLYEETRIAWLYLFRTGKIKKFRGKAYGTGTRSSDMQSMTSEGGGKMHRPNNLKFYQYAKRAPTKRVAGAKNFTSPKIHLNPATPNETKPLLIKSADHEHHRDDPLDGTVEASEKNMRVYVDYDANTLKYIDEPSPSSPVFKQSASPE